jgi:hypothetical protein
MALMVRPSALRLCLCTLTLLALAAPERAEGAADLDPLLPDDTESYVSVNVRQVLDSELFKKFGLDAAREALKNADEVNDVLKDLGFDPFKDLEGVIVAAPGGTETDRGLVIIRGNFDVAKFKAKADDVANNQPDVLKIHKVPDGTATHVVYEVIVPGQDNTLFVAVANKSTLLASPGKDYVVDALKKLKGKGKAALKNKAMQALLEKMDPRQSLSVAVLSSAVSAKLGADAPKLAKDILARLDAVGGGITVSNEVKLEVSAAAKTGRDARQLKANADKGVQLVLVGLALLGSDRKEIAAALEVLKTVKVSAKGKVITISAKVTADVIADALNKDEEKKDEKKEKKDD